MTISPFDFQIGGDHYKVDKDVPTLTQDVAEFCMRNELGFAESCIIKYVFRHKRKNGWEDILKAFHWLLFIAWVTYAKDILDVCKHFGVRQTIEPLPVFDPDEDSLVLAQHPDFTGVIDRS
jgi:hypothetical protein